MAVDSSALKMTTSKSADEALYPAMGSGPKLFPFHPLKVGELPYKCAGLPPQSRARRVYSQRSFCRMSCTFLSAFLAFIGSVAAAVFGAIMTVPAWTAAANLKTVGLAPRTCLFFAVGVAVAGFILFVRCMRKSRSSGHALVEAGRIINSRIEDNYSEWGGKAVKAKLISGSSVLRNIFKRPDDKAGN
jgi:hypothetical protein